MPSTVPHLTRRTLLRSAALSAGALAFGPGFYRQALAAAPATPGPGPYGPVGAFDQNGIALPEGFTSRRIAVGEATVPGTDYVWHKATDGQATFPRRDGDGWILVANSEAGGGSGGGVSSITFDGEGRIVGARRLLSGTAKNCSGGATPWGTWISCEEHLRGRAWECDPTGATPPVELPALGTFSHESLCVDPLAERLYMTEDEPDGCLYRFTPAAYPDLTDGLLEVALLDSGGLVTWAEVPDRNGNTLPTKDQVAGAHRFDGGEGMWFDSGVVFFTTKGDCKVWALNTVSGELEVVYDRVVAGDGSPLRSVDNVTVTGAGDVYVCEDGDNYEIAIITPDRQVATFVRLDPALHGDGNETVGVVFDPSGYRMYFGTQRTYSSGAVYEVTGPFRGNAGTPPAGLAGPVSAPRFAEDEEDDAKLPPPAPAPAGAPVPAAVVLAPTGEGPMTGADTVAPGVRLVVPARASIATLAGRGVPLTLEVDEPAAVDVRLVAAGGRTLGVRTTAVAVRGRVRLRVKASPARSRSLRRRTRSQRATLIVTVTDLAGNRTRVRRAIMVRPAPRKRRGR